MDQPDFKEIEKQLYCPNGQKGVEVGEMMHATNLGMTLSAIDAIQLGGKSSVLEIGHGNAKHVVDLMRKNKGLRYYGLDISGSMYDEAIKNTALYKNRVSFHLYDGGKIPFEADFFDKVFTVNTVYFWKEPQKLMAEVYRVMKSGGFFAISYADKTFMKQLPFVRELFTLYDAEGMKTLVSHTAFELKGIDQQTEKVESKSGDEVERLYHVALLKK